MDERLLEKLVDPIDKSPLRRAGDSLLAENGRCYPIIQGIPILLAQGVDQTIGLADWTLKAVAERRPDDDWYVDTTGMGDDKLAALCNRLTDAPSEDAVDPIVSYLVGATNGLLYEQRVGRLADYPIPEIRLRPVAGASWLLDIGCGWGRWSIAAARRGYEVIGLDPSLGAVLAGRRAARQLGLSIHWVVGDARYLPFKGGSIDQAFSYSVLQHLCKSDAGSALEEIRRVLTVSGQSMIQMPNALGVRSFYHLFRRKFRQPRGFEVRYYRPAELLSRFQETIGPSKLSADGYFGLGIQGSDKRFMPLKYRMVIVASEALRRLSLSLSPLSLAADSLYVESTKKQE